MCIFHGSIIGLGEYRASFESDLSREARHKGDLMRANKKIKNNKKNAKSDIAKARAWIDPLAPKGHPIGGSGTKLWKRERFESGEKKLNRSQKKAGREEWAKTGYRFPLYATECVLGPILTILRNLDSHFWVEGFGLVFLPSIFPLPSCS